MKVLISCGEPSGDLYAGALAREIRSLDPSARIFGLGGERLREGGGTLNEDYRGLTATGLSEALTVLPRSFATYRRLVQLARTERPDVFVPIDFPELNLRLAATLQKMGIPVVYYVCPQVWAWRRGRFRSIKRSTDRALVIFPFEEAIYRQGWSPGRVRWAPSAGALRVRAPQSGVSSGKTARSICADGRAAARQPAERGAGDPTRPGPRGTARASEGLRRPVHRGPRAASRGPSVCAACPPDERGTAGGHRGGSDRRCAGGIRCRCHGVRDRDGPNRHPRTPPW